MDPRRSCYIHNIEEKPRRPRERRGLGAAVRLSGEGGRLAHEAFDGGLVLRGISFGD